jgi:hypothetical protein
VMPPSPPHLRGLRLRSVVRIDVHGSKDRAKDASPGACDDLSCLRRVHAHRSRMPTAFPSSASFRHPVSSARLVSREDTHESSRTDRGPRSDDAPRRAPPSRKPGCLSPPRHAKELVTRRDRSLRPSRRLSRSRRPHLSPVEGGVLDGHCKGTVRSPASPCPAPGWCSRVQTPFAPAGTSVPGADDPSTPTSSTDPTVDEDRLPRSHRCRSQRLDGFYDREPAARCAANFMSAVMPETVRTRNKINWASITFLSTWLSTAAVVQESPQITARLVFRLGFVRKKPRSPRAVVNLLELNVAVRRTIFV